MDDAAEHVVERFAQEVLRLRAEYEFSTFWLGTRIPGPVSQAEAIAFRRNLNQRVGLRVLELAPNLTPTPENPEARITLHYVTAQVTVAVRPLLVYGRYRKLSRAIPQSKWPCRRCRGAGCNSCGGTGKRFLRTVEELVAAPILSVSGAVGTKLHCTGREDVDARMLGSGRPFVLELADPRVRSFDLNPIQERINRELGDEVAVEQLQFADQALLRTVNSINPDKSYRAVVECLAPAGRNAIERLAGLRDVTLRQETPRRVLHRRANRVRFRVVRDCSVELPPGSGSLARFSLSLRVQSGTYIKEFISGDQGRTTPSVAELLGVPCACAELDVLEVHCDPLCGEVTGSAE
ncbi:MAG: tRNA pseudouridine(54/55) synthase Pus10 [Pseudomonadota bacterium]